MNYPKTILWSGVIAAFCLTGAAYAQTNDAAAQQNNQSEDVQQLGTIQATGILGSQIKSIRHKRFAPSIQDTISAENIGKLPDNTIADSLQRVTGVQINRSAGEGASVNVRGLAQVQTLLNGEYFISAANIVGTQPDFTSVPAQLFEGVDVLKSATADVLNTGISGTINLRTRRPFDMDNGWTVAGSVAATRGSDVGKTQPKANVLFSYNEGNQWGFLLSIAGSNITHQNSGYAADLYGSYKILSEPASYNGNTTGDPDNDWAANGAQSANGALAAFTSQGVALPPDFTRSGGAIDLNGDGKYDGAFMSGDLFVPAQDRIERQRLGVDGSFQMHFGENQKLTVDYFYTKLDQNERNISAEIMPPFWFNSPFWYGKTKDTGVMVNHGTWGDIGTPAHLYTTQAYKFWVGDFEAASKNNWTRSISRNLNVEYNFGSGPFTGEFRLVSGSAQSTMNYAYIEMATSNGSPWSSQGTKLIPNTDDDGNPIYQPGASVYDVSNVSGPSGKYYDMDGNVHTWNASGIPAYQYPLTIDTSGSWVAVNLGSAMANTLENKDAYVLKGVVGDDGYTRNAGMNILRFDGHYALNTGLKLDFGVRNSIRTARNSAFNLASTIYPNYGNGGCDVMYHSYDISLSAAGCQVSDKTDTWFMRATGKHTGQGFDALGVDYKYYTDVGQAKGLNFYAVDPKSMDDPIAWADKLYPGMTPVNNPAQTWDVTLHETSAYLQADFDGAVNNLPVSGNVGVRVVNTNLLVNQHKVGGARAGYNMPPQDAGLQTTNTSYYDILPTANLSASITDDLVLRASWAKNMMPLNLAQWGGGLTIGYALSAGCGCQEAKNGNSGGNPNLNPWRTTNEGLSLEYYFNDKSMISLAYFHIDIKSFLVTGTYTLNNVPAQDDPSHLSSIAVTAPVQGAGQTLHGLEFSYQQAFSDAPGILANTGLTFNWTYSPSDTGDTDLAGNALAFQGNSKNVGNLILWYQGDHLQVRLAGNYRSKRTALNGFGGIAGLTQYQNSQTYVDASVSYSVNPHWTVFLQGNNLTGQNQKFYYVWPEQVGHMTKFEKRWTLGVRFNY